MAAWESEADLRVWKAPKQQAATPGTWTGIQMVSQMLPQSLIGGWLGKAGLERGSGEGDAQDMRTLMNKGFSGRCHTQSQGPQHPEHGSDIR